MGVSTAREAPIFVLYATHALLQAGCVTYGRAKSTVGFSTLGNEL